MASGRNVFLEAALAGKPVFSPRVPSSDKVKAEKEKRAAPNQKKAETEKERSVIKEATKCVGRLPVNVLEYVRSHTDGLGPVQKSYYSNIGEPGGPSIQAARKRVSRRLTEVATTTKAKASAAKDKNVAILAEQLYVSDTTESEDDIDKRYLLDDSERADAVKAVERVRKAKIAERDDPLQVPVSVVDSQKDEPVVKKKAKTSEKSGKRDTRSQKRQIDDVLKMMPAMTESVMKAAKAHERAVKKWQEIISSDSD